MHESDILVAHDLDLVDEPELAELITRVAALRDWRTCAGAGLAPAHLELLRVQLELVQRCIGEERAGGSVTRGRCRIFQGARGSTRAGSSARG